MYDPADEIANYEEFCECIDERDARADAEACDTVDAIMQGDFE